MRSCEDAEKRSDYDVFVVFTAASRITTSLSGSEERSDDVFVIFQLIAPLRVSGSEERSDDSVS